jgi:hypothetical protein
MRKSAETPTRPTMPKVEETKTSLTTTNPTKKSTHPMTVNDAKTMMMNIVKMSNRPTAMDSVTTSTRPMPTTKAARC